MEEHILVSVLKLMQIVFSIMKGIMKMKTCENCGHQRICEFFNDWPNCPHWEPQLVHSGECKGWDDEEWARKNCPWKDENIIQTADAFCCCGERN